MYLITIKTLSFPHSSSPVRRAKEDLRAYWEVGIDISKNQTKDVFDFFKQGRIYSYVITVCDEASAERCPVFPGMAKKLHWSFTDPSQFTGTHDEKLAKTRVVRDEIKRTVLDFTKQG